MEIVRKVEAVQWAGNNKAEVKKVAATVGGQVMFFDDHLIVAAHRDTVEYHMEKQTKRQRMVRDGVALVDPDGSEVFEDVEVDVQVMQVVKKPKAIRASLGEWIVVDDGVLSVKAHVTFVEQYGDPG